MTQTKPNPIVHLLPSLTDVAFLLPLILMFTKLGGSRALLGDGDTGWHIRTGEWILANHRVPRADIFSFTKPGQPWFAWEWLSDVIFGWLHQNWGLGGVVVLGMLVLCTTSALLFRLILRRCPHPVIAIGFTFAALWASSIHWHVRPHIFTFFFVTIFLHVLYSAQEGKRKLLFVLPALTLIWTNLHGGFFVGIVLIACYMAGALIAWALEPDPVAKRAHLESAAADAGTALACAAVSLVNPYGYRLHLFIAEYLRAPFLSEISEFMSPSFRSLSMLVPECLIIAALTCAGWSVYRRRFADVLLVLGWTHLSLYSLRNLPIFAIVASPVTAGVVYELLGILASSQPGAAIRQRAAEVLAFGDEIASMERPWRLHLVSGAVVLLLAVGIVDAVPGSKLAASFDPDTFPVAALSAVRDLGPSSRLFATDQWGDFLIYSQYPNVAVYFDGRSDFYGGDFVKEYVSVIGAQHGWVAKLDRYSVNAVLLPVEQPLSEVLKRTPGWTPVFDDHKAILFRRCGLQDQPNAFSASTPENARDRNIVPGVNRCEALFAANPNRSRTATGFSSN